MISIIYLFSLILFYCNGFNNQFPIVSYTKKFNNLKDINVVEPKYTSKSNTSCVIFFTGGSSFIIPEIYNDFMMNLVYNNIAVYTPSFRYEKINDLVNILNNKYKEVVIAGHSSGGSTAINNCNNKIINKLILIDPVKNNIFRNNYNLNFIESVLFLNAEKSYKISYEPFGLPFIPFFRISRNELSPTKNCKILSVNANNYGHSDILDKPFANMMHKTRISVGNKNRSYGNLNKYHNWMGNIINNFIKNKYNNLKYLNKINNTIINL